MRALHRFLLTNTRNRLSNKLELLRERISADEQTVAQINLRIDVNKGREYQLQKTITTLDSRLNTGPSAKPITS